MKMYIVQNTWDDGTVTVSLATKEQIINHIDMLDCTDEEFKVFDGSKYGKMEELRVHGTWHDPSNPLYIKLTRADGSIAFDGYGTDH